jgi:hypothetical protein
MLARKGGGTVRCQLAGGESFINNLARQPMVAICPSDGSGGEGGGEILLSSIVARFPLQVLYNMVAYQHITLTSIRVAGFPPRCLPIQMPQGSHNVHVVKWERNGVGRQ